MTTTITQLPAGTALTGPEKFAADQGTSTVRITATQIAAFVGSGSVPASSPFSQSTVYAQGTIGLALQNFVSVKDAPYNAVGDGTTDDTAAVQAALIAAITNGFALYFPCLCKITSGLTIGNTAGTVTKPITIFGNGPQTGIKVSAANVTALTIAGTNPLVDVNRYIGRATICNISFQGPGAFAPGGTGTGIFFNGAQGILLDSVWVNGWGNGVKLTAVDLITVQNSWFQYNDYGVYNLENAASFAYPQGILNSGNFFNNKFLHNATSGLYIWGGTSQTVCGNNFVANGISINVASPLGISAVAVGTQIYGNYFENSTTNDIAIGGNGICRAGSIYGNTSLVANGTTAIRLFNVSNSGGYGVVRNNQMSAISGSFTAISQSGSAETWDVDAQTGSGYRPGSLVAITKTGVTNGSSVNIFKIGTNALDLQGTMVVKCSSTGIATTKVYNLSVMGSGNTVATLTAATTQNYSGGASAFTATDTVDTPVAGTNTISLNNGSGATCRFDVTIFIVQLGGVLTLL